MPIASAVVTLDDRPELRSHALQSLCADGRIEVGASEKKVVPVVLDTATAEEGADLVQSLLSTAGVLSVDIVAVDFSCDEAT